MATILPGSPPTFNKNDVSGTVKSLCNYTRSMQENLDFILGQLKKDLAAVKGDVEWLTTKTDSLQTTMNGVHSSVSDLGNQYNQLAARVAALEQKAN